MAIQPPDNSEIDLGRYVAVGDSITSGYADGALYYEGQLNAYASILAGQIKKAGGGNFIQPLMNPNSPGVDMLGNARLVLERKADTFILAHSQEQGDVAALKQNKYILEGPYHNMGVPGAKAITVVAPGFGNPDKGAGNYNPFFTRMVSNPATASILSDALLLDPTFFTLFIGNNDALAYALSGGTENAMSEIEGSAGQGFEGSLDAILEALTANGAKGVIATLPSIANIPYFNAIPYNGLLLTAAESETLNAYHQGKFSFHEGKNPFLVSDVMTGPGMIRQAEKGDRILLDLILDKHKDDYLLGKAAIPKKYSLMASQAEEVEARIFAYNAIIRAMAEKKGLGLADINHLVKSASLDRHYNPVTRTLDYDRKGVFSLDGLHPNAFGQALLANEFIRIINGVFHSNISPVKSYRYKSIIFP